jgi:mediator of RNA polymerase II transcription subunit 14
MPRPSPARPGAGPASAASHHSPHGSGPASTGQGGGPSNNSFANSFVSRVLPQRSWAGAIPTTLSHEAFDVLCTLSPLPGSTNQTYFDLLNFSLRPNNNFIFLKPGEMDETFSAGGLMAPLERFLGCIYMRRHLQRIIQDYSDGLAPLPITEPGVIPFKYGIYTSRLQ